MIEKGFILTGDDAELLNRARFGILHGRREDVANQSNFGQCREAPPECKRKKVLRAARSHVALIDVRLLATQK